MGRRELVITGISSCEKRGTRLMREAFAVTERDDRLVGEVDLRARDRRLPFRSGAGGAGGEKAGI